MTPYMTYPRDSNVVLHQLSYQANWELAILILNSLYTRRDEKMEDVNKA